MKSAREILSFSGASFSGAAFVTVLRVRVVGALLTVFVVLALRAALVCVVLRGLGFFSAASVTVAGVSDTGALSLSVIQNPEGSGDSSPDKRKIAALLSPGWEERLLGHQGKKNRPCPFGSMACVLCFSPGQPSCTILYGIPATPGQARPCRDAATIRECVV